MAKKTDNVVVLADHRNPAAQDGHDGKRTFLYHHSDAFTDASLMIYPLDEEGNMSEERGYIFRFNNRANSLEVRDATRWNWRTASDGFMARLCEEIEKRYEYKRPHGGKPIPLHFSDAALSRVIAALRDKTEEDPFCVYLENLPAWDKTLRLDLLLTTLFRADGTTLTQWATRQIFLGAVHRALEPGALIRTWPLLIGPQGVGKSAFLRNLFPPEHQAKLFSDSYNVHESDAARKIESCMGSVLCEISEMAGLGKASLERVKADLSRTNDKLRLPYAKSPSDIPRRHVFCGTSNNLAVLPNDESGNDRFLPVECKRGQDPVEPYLDANREQLWAEAWALYEIGARPILPEELKAAQAERNEEHRARDYVIEDELPGIMASMDQPLMRDIMGRLQLSSTPNEMGRVGKALRLLGYKDRRKSGGGPRYWAKI